MTDLHVPAEVSPSRRPRTDPQWRAVTRLLVREALRSLLVATAVVLSVGLVGSLVARRLGWQLIASHDRGAMSLGVVADGDGVTVVTSLLLVAGAVGVAALVMAVVLATRTRVLVAAGATRGSVAIANLLTALVMTAYVLTVAGVVLVVVGEGPGGVADLLGADGPLGVARRAVEGLGAVLLALVAGAAITTMFLRWPWWVGVLVLTVGPWAFSIVLVVAGLTDVREQLAAAGGWVLSDLVVAGVVAAVYWAMLRRVQVP